MGNITQGGYTEVSHELSAIRDHMIGWLLLGFEGKDYG